MRKLLHRWINLSGTPHMVLFNLLWWFFTVLANWTGIIGNGCMWTAGPDC